MRNRQKEQLRTYSGFQIPKTVVTRYLKGDWSVRTLVKSIDKFNKNKGIKNEKWREKLIELDEKYPGKTREEKFNEIIRESRMVDFFEDTDISYGAALNEALGKVNDQNEEKKKLDRLGKHIDFSEWNYNEGNQEMEFFNKEIDEDGQEKTFLYQVSFVDAFDGNYENGALKVNRILWTGKI